MRLGVAQHHRVPEDRKGIHMGFLESIFRSVLVGPLGRQLADTVRKTCVRQKRSPSAPIIARGTVASTTKGVKETLTQGGLETLRASVNRPSDTVAYDPCTNDKGSTIRVFQLPLEPFGALMTCFPLPPPRETPHYRSVFNHCNNLHTSNIHHPWTGRGRCA